jgi:hypothetical protein
MEAKMESLGNQKHKNPETGTLKKTATSRDRRKWVHGHLGGGSSNALFSIKITTIPEIVHIGLQASKITARASKMSARASKIIENWITSLVKNETLEVKKTRRSKQTEKWHGGGICAQRTGYI